MLEALVGVVSALVGIAVGIWLRDRHYKQQEARKKARAYARRADTRRLRRAATKPLTESDRERLRLMREAALNDTLRVTGDAS